MRKIISALALVVALTLNASIGHAAPAISSDDGSMEASSGDRVYCCNYDSGDECYANTASECVKVCGKSGGGACSGKAAAGASDEELLIEYLVELVNSGELRVEDLAQ